MGDGPSEMGVWGPLLAVLIPFAIAIVQHRYTAHASGKKSTNELTAAALADVSEDGRLTRQEVREMSQVERQLNGQLAAMERRLNAALLDSARHRRGEEELGSALQSILDHARTIDEARAYARRVLPAPDHSLAGRMRSEPSPSGLITLEEVSES